MNEELLFESIRKLNLSEAQYEAVCNLYSAIYENGISDRIRSLYDKDSFLKSHPRAKQLAAAGLIGMSTLFPTAALYNETRPAEQTQEITRPASEDETAIRKFIMDNLCGKYKCQNDSDSNAAYVKRVYDAVDRVAKVTNKYKVGKAELVALMLVESNFNPAPYNPRGYKGIAQMGDSALIDARKYATQFGLNPAEMNDPENVEQAASAAAAYLLRIMYTTDRSNAVLSDGRDNHSEGDIRYAFACYNGGIGLTSKLGKSWSVPMLYRAVADGEMSRQDAISINPSMVESLDYPGKILHALDALAALGVETNFDSSRYTYNK